MPKSLIVHPDARSEIGSAALWYEDRSLGLGADFMRVLDAALAQIRRTPQRFPVVEEPIRRAPAAVSLRALLRGLAGFSTGHRLYARPPESRALAAPWVIANKRINPMAKARLLAP
jgi:hypothetical protein